METSPDKPAKVKKVKALDPEAYDKFLASPVKPHVLDELPTGIDAFFLDSGAHSLYTREVINKKRVNGYAFYESKDFDSYLEAYASFLAKHGTGNIDFFVNVDAIFNPDLTWRAQKKLEALLEQRGVKQRPVPVIHYGTPLHWVQKYLDDGHTYLGIGGLGQEVTKEAYYSWADRLFAMLCPESNGFLPLAKTHGFAMTSWELMRRYPWYSVDSASWIKAAAFGQIYVPHKRGGKFDFTVQPYSITVSGKSPSMKEKDKHVLTLSPGARQIVEEWLTVCGVPLGKVDKKGDLVEWGAVSHHKPRAILNLLYFKGVVDSIPPYPWPFKIKIRKGLFDQ